MVSLHHNRSCRQQCVTDESMTSDEGIEIILHNYSEDLFLHEFLSSFSLHTLLPEWMAATDAFNWKLGSYTMCAGCSKRTLRQNSVKILQMNRAHNETCCHDRYWALLKIYESPCDHNSRGMLPQFSTHAVPAAARTSNFTTSGEGRKINDYVTRRILLSTVGRRDMTGNIVKRK